MYSARLALLATLFTALGSAWSAVAQYVPEAGSPAYRQIIEASKSEQGVVVYANLPARTWGPFRKLLTETYPWVKLETTDQGAELWEKYFAESSAGVRTADIVTTTAPDRFANFIDRGQLVDYTALEHGKLPEWSRQEPGLYTLSASPGIIMYNRFRVKNPPQSLAAIADLARSDPKAFEGRFSTYNAAANPFGLAMVATWLEGKGNTWDTLAAIGRLSRPETGGATMREKVSSGEYAVAFFLNAVSVPPLEQPEVKRVIGWNYIGDGTPVSLQGVGITKAAGSPNTARIVLDLMLSRDGQIAFAQGGLTPYRDDVAQNEVPYDTLATVKSKVGESNLLFYSYRREKIAAWPTVLERWKQAFQKP